MFQQIKLHNTLAFIRQANGPELRSIIDAVNARYIITHPDWDVVYLALPKYNPAERDRLLQKALSMLPANDA